MGMGDKVSGRVKKATGDLLGNEDLHREGAQEERKGEAEEELAEREARLEREQRRTEAKAQEVENLERSTDAGDLADRRTKDELYDEAAAKGVPGRSDMTKEELAEEVRRRS